MNPYQGAAAVYQDHEVTTATPVELVVRVLGGAISRIERARRAADRGEINTLRTQVDRARALVSELMSALDFEEGGEIAERLGALYQFLLTELLHPQVRPNVAALDSAADVLAKIKEGFDAILASGS